MICSSVCLWRFIVWSFRKARLQFTLDQFKGATVTFINLAFGGLIITPRVCEVIFPDGRQQIAPIHWQAIQGMCLGTMRPIFGCPCCGHHTFKLYELHGSLHCWKCAFARGVRYASQQVSRKGRRYLQSQRLRRFLGENPNYRAIHRPLWMAHHTASRRSRLRRRERPGKRKDHRRQRVRFCAFRRYVRLNARALPVCGARLGCATVVRELSCCYNRE